MGYTLRLKESDSVTLPRADVRSLLRCGSGSAALLYLYLAEGGQGEDTAICRALHWDRAALDEAEGQLQALGLLGERTEAAPALEAPERACPEYSRRDIAAALEKNGDFAALRKAVQDKLNKPLTEKDDGMLLGLYNFLGLPSDVIYLLVCHCVERTERRYGRHRRPTVRQIEKEGYRWARLGLMTQELAGEYLKEYARKQELVPALMAALQLGDRPPVSRELEFLERWIDWGFGPEAVAVAYEKTVFKCGRLEWKYLNGILRDWDKKGLHTGEEIATGDKLPPKERAAGRSAARKKDEERAAAVQESADWMDAYLKQMETM